MPYLRSHGPGRRGHRDVRRTAMYLTTYVLKCIDRTSPREVRGSPGQHQEAEGQGKEVTTMTNLERIRKGLSPARRRKIDARAARLMSEEMTLRELRQARKLTQVRMAKALGITQDGVSRLEKRSDLLLSTLRKSVEAMGGKLSLVAEFPDRAPVVLSGIAEEGPGIKAAGRKGARAHA